VLCTLVRIHSSWEQFVMAEIRSTGTQSRGTFAVTHHMIIRSLIIADPCGSTPLPCSRLKSTLRRARTAPGARQSCITSTASCQSYISVRSGFTTVCLGRARSRYNRNTIFGFSQLLYYQYKYNPVLLLQQSYCYYL
jgi:hypothetical protein